MKRPLKWGRRQVGEERRPNDDFSESGIIRYTGQKISLRVTLDGSPRFKSTDVKTSHADFWRTLEYEHSYGLEGSSVSVHARFSHPSIHLLNTNQRRALKSIEETQWLTKAMLHRNSIARFHFHKPSYLRGVAITWSQFCMKYQWKIRYPIKICGGKWTQYYPQWWVCYSVSMAPREFPTDMGWS